MRYFYYEMEIANPLDEYGAGTERRTVVLAAPNKVAVWHHIARSVLESQITEEGRLSYIWDGFTGLEGIEVNDIEPLISEFKEVKNKDHFDILGQYTDQEAYSYEEMSALGNYSFVFSKEVITNCTTSEDSFYRSQLRNAIRQSGATQVKRTGHSEILDFQLQVFYPDALCVEFHVTFEMESGVKICAVISERLNGQSVIDRFFEDGTTSHYLLDSTVRFGVSAAGAQESQIELDKQNVKNRISNIDSVKFLKFAVFALSQQLKRSKPQAS